jgi:hypothetical protein
MRTWTGTYCNGGKEISTGRPVLMVVYGADLFVSDPTIPRKVTVIIPDWNRKLRKTAEITLLFCILSDHCVIYSRSSAHTRCTKHLTRRTIQRIHRGAYHCCAFLYAPHLPQLCVSSMCYVFWAFHSAITAISYATARTRWPAILTRIADHMCKVNDDLTLRSQAATTAKDEHDFRDQIQEGRKIVELINLLQYRISKDMEMECALRHTLH